MTTKFLQALHWFRFLKILLFFLFLCCSVAVSCVSRKVFLLNFFSFFFYILCMLLFQQIVKHIDTIGIYSPIQLWKPTDSCHSLTSQYSCNISFFFFLYNHRYNFNYERVSYIHDSTISGIECGAVQIKRNKERKEEEKTKRKNYSLRFENQFTHSERKIEIERNIHEVKTSDFVQFGASSL